MPLYDYFISRLKKAKELERLKVEHQSQLVSQPVDILRESDKDMRQREMEEAEEIHRIQTRLRQKNKETKRYGQLRLEKHSEMQ